MDKTVKLNFENTYYWYYKNSLRQLQSGYQGKLLDGTYQKKTRNQYLIQQGTFKAGLKEDKWLSWHRNGNIKTMHHYRKGELHGNFSEYYPDGKVKSINMMLLVILQILR
jgi:antitoxin component YwqK of YwqJK toxin-antitoxin module